MGTSPCGNPLPYTDNLESPRNGEWRIPFHTGTGNHNVWESCFEVDNQVQLIFTLNRLIFLTVWLTYNLICFLQEQERSLRTLKTLGNITRSHSWLGFGLRSESVTLKHEILVISNSNFWFVKSVALKTRGKPVVWWRGHLPWTPGPPSQIVPKSIAYSCHRCILSNDRPSNLFLK